ncbi:MAG TPA: PEGA domain-containing protein [Pyrinomonadaceae bacterium]|nr:PEGA domain-containing protein [Pyrinomonadaceae bacterium]
MKFTSFVLLMCMVVITTPFALAQTTSTEPSPQAAATPIAFGLQDGTPIKLRINRNMSSADAKTGETVDFEVLEDVKSGDLTIIRKGSFALGTVTRGKPKARMGRGGKLDINIDSVQTLTGEKLALRAVKQTKGYNSAAPMTGAIVAAGILFFPAAPFFLFMKGKDIKIPKGTEITAYINGDSPLDKNKFIAANAPVPSSTEIPVQTASVETAASNLQVKSSPEGAEITVNGNFVGSTPSSFVLKAGEHTIVIKKPGFQPWERNISLLAGSSITLDAALEKVQ